MAILPGRHDRPMPESEHAALRAWLAAKAALTAAQVQAILGTGANGRTRGEVAAVLVTWLRTRPKGA